jgi:CheY-like chemotaxis protein
MAGAVDLLPTLRVLIVDGDADSREVYREAFATAGWYVAEAVDGREALVRVLTEKPAVVVIELRLQFISGLALCEILRRDQKTATLPIVVVTAETSTAELARADRVGANAVLVKPKTADAILLEMHKALLARPRLPLRSPLPTPGAHRTSLVKAHHRIETSDPSVPPAELLCPVCTRRLQYQKTYIGGVNRLHPERWDYYVCAACGDFQYRYRTRKLRQL